MCVLSRAELAELDWAIMGATRGDNVLADWTAARDRLIQELADALLRANVIPIEKGHRRAFRSL
jgi:hypothetical protein